MSSVWESCSEERELKPFQCPLTHPSLWPAGTALAYPSSCGTGDFCTAKINLVHSEGKNWVENFFSAFYSLLFSHSFNEYTPCWWLCGGGCFFVHLTRMKAKGNSKKWPQKGVSYCPVQIKCWALKSTPVSTTPTGAAELLLFDSFSGQGKYCVQLSRIQLKLNN